MVMQAPGGPRNQLHGLTVTSVAVVVHSEHQFDDVSRCDLLIVASRGPSAHLGFRAIGHTAILRYTCSPGHGSAMYGFVAIP